jgi:glycosyltransferase involved in cell wall biosynthesis
MAVGTPVVAYAHGAVPEVLGDCGTLVTAGDRSGLAAALAELLLDDERRRRLGECGRQRVAARFTPTAMVAGLQDCYATAATGSHRGRPRRR